MTLKRFTLRMKKGILWLYILKLLMEKPHYGYELKQELQQRFGFGPAIITNYVVLYRLTRQGFVTVKWKEPVKGRLRKYYAITEEGKEAFLDGKKLLEGIVSEF